MLSSWMAERFANNAGLPFPLDPQSYKTREGDAKHRINLRAPIGGGGGGGGGGGEEAARPALEQKAGGQ